MWYIKEKQIGFGSDVFNYALTCLEIEFEGIFKSKCKTEICGYVEYVDMNEIKVDLLGSEEWFLELLLGHCLHPVPNIRCSPTYIVSTIASFSLSKQSIFSNVTPRETTWDLNKRLLINESTFRHPTLTCSPLIVGDNLVRISNSVKGEKTQNNYVNVSNWKIFEHSYDVQPFTFKLQPHENSLIGDNFITVLGKRVPAEIFSMTYTFLYDHFSDIPNFKIIMFKILYELLKFISDLHKSHAFLQHLDSNILIIDIMQNSITISIDGLNSNSLGENNLNYDEQFEKLAQMDLVFYCQFCLEMLLGLSINFSTVNERIYFYKEDNGQWNRYFSYDIDSEIVPHCIINMIQQCEENTFLNSRHILDLFEKELNSLSDMEKVIAKLYLMLQDSKQNLLTNKSKCETKLLTRNVKRRIKTKKVDKSKPAPPISLSSTLYIKSLFKGPNTTLSQSDQL
ncbi:hypothetical protein QTN25_000430 [Entamoeba marina]